MRRAAWCLCLLGCGVSRVPPQELTEARMAYGLAEQGLAARLAPSELEEARSALATAESEMKTSGASARTADLAYVAVRRLQWAESLARTTDYTQRAEQLRTQVSQVLTGELEGNRTALLREQAAREEAERRARESLAELRRIAQVRSEPRGVVIVLSAGVMFRGGEAKLLSAADGQLVPLCNALLAHDIRSELVVEVHSDDQGGAAKSLQLSQQRADAVLKYLVDCGVSRERLSAVGKGDSEPVADNHTLEGRAQNRRVELVVKPPAESVQPAPSEPSSEASTAAPPAQ